MYFPFDYADTQAYIYAEMEKLYAKILYDFSHQIELQNRYIRVFMKLEWNEMEWNCNYLCKYLCKWTINLITSSII